MSLIICVLNYLITESWKEFCNDSWDQCKNTQNIKYCWQKILSQTIVIILHLLTNSICKIATLNEERNSTSKHRLWTSSDANLMEEQIIVLYAKRNSLYFYCNINCNTIKTKVHTLPQLHYCNCKCPGKI